MCSGRKHPKVPRQWMDQDGPTDERRRIEYVRNGPPYVWRWIGSISRSTYGSATASTHSTARAATASLCVCGCVQWPVDGSGRYVNGLEPDRPGTVRRHGRTSPSPAGPGFPRQKAVAHPPTQTHPPTPLARALNARLAAAAGIRSEASRALPREGRRSIPHQPPRPACARSGTGTYTGRSSAAHPP